MSVPEGTADCPPPASGYDFVFHVGVGLPGALAVEQIAHKTGYDRADADGKLAPVVHAGEGSGDSLTKQDVLPAGHKSERGFGDGYEQFSDELQTSIDAAGLVEHLGRQGYQVSNPRKPFTPWLYVLNIFLPARTPVERRR